MKVVGAACYCRQSGISCAPGWISGVVGHIWNAFPVGEVVYAAGTYVRMASLTSIYARRMPERKGFFIPMKTKNAAYFDHLSLSWSLQLCV